MNEHTPGPWSVYADGGSFSTPGDSDVLIQSLEPRRHWIARMFHPQSHVVGTVSNAPEREEVAANARLIAAAPDLLALVLKAHKDLCGCQTMGDDCGWPDARAAIRKATSA